MRKLLFCMVRLFFCHGIEWLWSYVVVKFVVLVVSGGLVVCAKVDR